MTTAAIVLLAASLGGGGDVLGPPLPPVAATSSGLPAVDAAPREPHVPVTAVPAQAPAPLGVSPLRPAFATPRPPSSDAPSDAPRPEPPRGLDEVERGAKTPRSG